MALSTSPSVSAGDTEPPQVEKPTDHSRGFAYLNVTQFCGAANDNLLKQLLMFGVASGGIWADKLGAGAQAVGSLALAVPFVMLSGFAGQFCDRYSKRQVTIIVKLSEVFIAALALWGLVQSNMWIVLLSLILISIQSAFFSPAKYGILPEILPLEKLSRANGTINMFTYVAVILGGAFGGVLYDLYAPNLAERPDAEPHRWLPGLMLVVVGAIGTATSFGLPHVRPKNPSLPIRPLLFRTYLDTYREIRGTALATVIWAWSLFYFIVGGVAILILPDYKELLGISATQASGLMALLGISIGIGDFAAGRISGKRIRPELVSVGVVGTTVSFFILSVIPLNYFLVAVCLALSGFLSGFYMVPLQTMTQHLSTEEQRGRVLGLWNCASSLGIIVGNVVFIAAKQTHVASHRLFFLCGLLGVICAVAYFTRWRAIFLAAVESKPTTTVN